MTATLLFLLLLLLMSAVYSGSETGVYSVSHVRLEADARAGKPVARVLSWLTRDDAGLLITLLIGNNLMLELLTHGFERDLLPADLPPGSREVLATLLLTPVVFLFGELGPKDLFRQRPRLFLAIASPVLIVSRLVLLPLALPIRLASVALERAFGLRKSDVARALGREEMIEVFEEGTRTGALPSRARNLVHNVLVLRETPVSKVMVPWDRVRTVDLEQEDGAARAGLLESDFTRQPALGREGDGPAEVVGYLHQLDALGDERPVRELVRRIPRLSPDTPVDRGLSRLRTSGQRVALVGRPEAPLGLVTLMDLVAAIAQESAPPERR